MPRARRQLKEVIAKAEEALVIVRAEETKLATALGDAQGQRARNTERLREVKAELQLLDAESDVKPAPKAYPFGR